VSILTLRRVGMAAPARHTGPMPNALDVATPAARFRLVAVAEAVSWLGLLVAMFIKWILRIGEGGVPLMGPIHGAVFIAYIALAMLAVRPLRWDGRTTVLALVASVPPFGSVVFERWAARTGRLGELSATDATRRRG